MAVDATMAQKVHCLKRALVGSEASFKEFERTGLLDDYVDSTIVSGRIEYFSLLALKIKVAIPLWRRRHKH